MFCAAYGGDISVVSAGVLSIIVERKLRDDEWNADPDREPQNILSACKSSRPDGDKNLSKIFGPKWMAVLALAYRVEFADSPGLVELLTDALKSRGVASVAATGERGQDWGIPSRWLVARAMAGRGPVGNIPLGAQRRRREAAGHLGSLANRFAALGLPHGETDRWIGSLRKPTGHRSSKHGR